MAHAPESSPRWIPQGWGYAGWWNLGAGFVCSLLVVGSTIYSFGLYVLPFTSELGLSRAQANVGMMLLATGVAVWSPLVGSLLDRLPAAAVMCFGGAMLCAGLAGIAAAPSLPWICAAIGGPLALGMACAGPLAASTVVARWFRRRRGRAMGITAVSTAAGGFVMTQVGAYLILQYGWRTALGITGVGAGCLIASLALLFVRGNPSEGELRAAGEVADSGDPEIGTPEERAWSTRRLVASSNFWLLALGAGLLLASDQALLISKIPYLQDLGIELQAASFLVACQSASSTMGKIAIGFAADRVDLRKLFAVVAGAHLFMLAAFIMRPGYWTLLAVFSAAGVAIGGVHPILTTLIASAFGSRSYGSVYGRMNLVMQPLSLLALYFIGATHDRTGTYDAAFWTFGTLVFVSSFLVASVRLPGDAEADRAAPGKGFRARGLAALRRVAGGR